MNGFHDTANAVATVIYTHSLEPVYAVVWSGLWNLIGVLTSTGLVAFSVVSLLPVELVLNVGSGAGFAMVFSLFISAIIWNLGTWDLGLPASSSHTLIGSIMGVGLANAMLSGRVFGEGVNWAKAQEPGGRTGGHTIGIPQNQGSRHGENVGGACRAQPRGCHRTRRQVEFRGPHH